MAHNKKTVFLTGASGSMGHATFLELLTRRDRFDIVVLVLPTQIDKEKMQPYVNKPGVRFVWGDLTRYEDVLACVDGADIVLHPGAFIAPAADHNPDLAFRVNYGGTCNIIKAIKAQSDPDAVKLVYIGTVAMTGDRLPPIHVGRTGDPIKPSMYDAYALTKIAAERTVIESGLKHWVSLRQTYIAIPDAMGLMDPIMFHQPLNTCIEFCAPHDAGLLMANACEDDVPEDFWRRIYNIGGGPSCRVIYADYMDTMMKLLGMGDYRKIMERNWFALRNFHCQWFEDSRILNDYLHFQTEGLDDYLAAVKRQAPWYVRLAGAPVVRRLIPRRLIKQLVMKPMATRGKDGTLNWLDNDREGRISAFYNSREDWAAIPGWDAPLPAKPAFDDYTRLDHGYDENKPLSELDMEDMQGAAAFRGGVCLSTAMTAGDLSTPLRWRCAFGHEFEASPTLVLLGGYWCPDCEAPPWNYDEIARRNPFFAQVWYTNHDEAEHNYYPAECYRDYMS